MSETALRRLCNLKNWTLAELSERSGVSPKIVQSIAGGAVKRPTKDVLNKLSSALGVTVSGLEAAIAEDQEGSSKS